MTDGERGTMVLQMEKGISGASSFKPTAAPFVPSGSLSLSRPGSASSMAVHAAPFIPGAPRACLKASALHGAGLQ